MKKWITLIGIWEAQLFMACYGIARSRLMAVQGWRIVLASVLAAAVVLLFILGLMFLASLIFETSRGEREMKKVKVCFDPRVSMYTSEGYWWRRIRVKLWKLRIPTPFMSQYQKILSSRVKG